MLRIKKKEILERPRALLSVTNYSMQNSSLSREIDMPSLLHSFRAEPLKEIAAHSEASMTTSEDISTYWCCSALPIITFF